LFGPYIAPSRPGLQYHRISQLPSTPFRMLLPYHHSRPTCSYIPAVAFEDSVKKDHSPPTVMTTIRDAPTDRAWFHSACQLSNVTEVILCRSNGKDSGRVVGMLLFYSDGSRNAVGQYRLDWASQPIPVCDKSFRVRSEWYKTRYWDVGLEVGGASINRSSGIWREIPWSGKLSWLFTAQHSLIRHYED
jgi:hypothetical protein